MPVEMPAWISGKILGKTPRGIRVKKKNSVEVSENVEEYPEEFLMNSLHDFSYEFLDKFPLKYWNYWKEYFEDISTTISSGNSGEILK